MGSPVRPLSRDDPFHMDRDSRATCGFSGPAPWGRVQQEVLRTAHKKQKGGLSSERMKQLQLYPQLHTDSKPVANGNNTV